MCGLLYEEVYPTLPRLPLVGLELLPLKDTLVVHLDARVLSTEELLYSLFIIILCHRRKPFLALCRSQSFVLEDLANAGAR